MQKHTNRVLSLVLSLLLVIGLIPTTAFAAVDYNHDSSQTTDNYYNVVSKKDWNIAPGIDESEIVLNNDSKTRRQVAHVMVADVSNEYVKVTTSYNNMDTSVFAVNDMMAQATAAKELYGWNVVGAMNTCLSWYDGYPAEHKNEPLGFMMIDGEIVWDLTQKYGNLGFPTCIVIYNDERPEDMPKVQMTSITGTQDLNGYEEQVIPCSSGYIVKDGANIAGAANHADGSSAPRSVVGVTADGKVVIMENDGRQAISAGMSMYELAELMIDLGCVYACNCDGGGSSTFLSKRPGADLAVINSPSDGMLRDTTSGILFISTAPSDGQFYRAEVSVEHNNYTPNSVVTFSAVGTDLSGNPAEIPAEATWQIAEENMGTIEDGVFTSNGTTGTVTAQLVYDNQVVGEESINIVVPDTIEFDQPQMTIPFGKSANLSVTASIDGAEIALKPSDIDFAFTEDIGTLDGFLFTSVSEEEATATSADVTATLVFDNAVTASASISLGRGSEVIFDFEGENAADDWTYYDYNVTLPKGNKLVEDKTYLADAATGHVRNGEHSLGVEVDLTNAVSSGWVQYRLYYTGENFTKEGAIKLGFWVWFPEEAVADEIDVGLRAYNASNTLVGTAKEVCNPDFAVNEQEEAGWHYFSLSIPSTYVSLIFGPTEDNNNSTFFFQFYNYQQTWQKDTAMTVKNDQGKFTYFIDDITLEYSTAADDTAAPVFSNFNYAGSADSAALNNDAVLNESNLSFTANVSEDTTLATAVGLNAASVKAFIDGNEVPATYSRGIIYTAAYALNDGVHTVKFYAEDNNGNPASTVRTFTVNAGTSIPTVTLQPTDPEKTNLLLGSMYSYDIVASNIADVNSVTIAIDLNNASTWELDHMTVADGFAASYDVRAYDNLATITITRVGDIDASSNVLATIPLRVFYSNEETITHAKRVWVTAKTKQGLLTTVGGESVFFGSAPLETATEMSQGVFDAGYVEGYAPHKHTAAPVDDKAATCTEDGYTGRTYCDVCDSVVDWGTVIPAAGHDLDASVNGLQTCGNCGEKFFFENGAPKTGWIEDGDAIYYGKNDGSLADGAYTVDGHTYTFTDCVLTRGAWETDAEGLKICFWAGEQCHDGWYTMNGKQYHFHGPWADIGVIRIGVSVGGYDYYCFDENGVFLSDYNGLFIAENGVTYAQNGIGIYYGLVKSDAGDYYYINSKRCAVTNCTYSIGAAKTNGLLPAGRYSFGPDGKMLNPPVEPTPQPTDEPVVKSGLVHDEDGEVRYYVDGVAVYYGLAQDTDGSYYYINSTKKAVKDCTYSIGEAKANGLLPAGRYSFGPDGKMLNPPVEPTPQPTDEPVVKSGLVHDEDGEVRYYVDGVAVYYGLAQDTDGSYYYINSTKKAVKNCSYSIGEAKTNGLMPAGRYAFDADGRMILD